MSLPTCPTCVYAKGICKKTGVEIRPTTGCTYHTPKSVTKADRLTRWEGRDEDGPRAVMVNRDGNFAEEFQKILRKLARLEDVEERDEKNAVPIYEVT